MRLVVFNVFAGPVHRQRIWYQLADLTGWSVHLVVGSRWIDDYGHEVIADLNGSAGVTVQPVPVMMNGNIPLHFWRGNMQRIIKDARPNLVYTYSEPYGLAAAQIAASCPTEIPFGFHSAQNIVKSYPLPFRLSQKYVLKRAAFATSVSEEVTEGLRVKGYFGPVGQHTFGLSGEWFSPVVAAGASSGLRIAYVGRLAPEKGVDWLLDSVAKAGSAVHALRIFGDGPERVKLMQRASQLEGCKAQISFEGFVAPGRIRAAYEWADVLIVPSVTTSSWKEQFGRVVIEASARGCMPITSSSGELPRLVRHLGFGDVVPEGDVRLLADTIRNQAAALAGLRASRAFRLERVQSLYSERAVALQLATAFNGATT